MAKFIAYKDTGNIVNDAVSKCAYDSSNYSIDNLTLRDNTLDNIIIDTEKIDTRTNRTYATEIINNPNGLEYTLEGFYFNVNNIVNNTQKTGTLNLYVLSANQIHKTFIYPLSTLTNYLSSKDENGSVDIYLKFPETVTISSHISIDFKVPINQTYINFNSKRTISYCGFRLINGNRPRILSDCSNLGPITPLPIDITTKDSIHYNKIIHVSDNRNNYITNAHPTNATTNTRNAGIVIGNKNSSTGDKHPIENYLTIEFDFLIGGDFIDLNNAGSPIYTKRLRYDGYDDFVFIGVYNRILRMYIYRGREGGTQVLSNALRFDIDIEYDTSYRFTFVMDKTNPKKFEIYLNGTIATYRMYLSYISGGYGYVSSKTRLQMQAYFDTWLMTDQTPNYYDQFLMRGYFAQNGAWNYNSPEGSIHGVNDGIYIKNFRMYYYNNARDYDISQTTIPVLEKPKTKDVEIYFQADIIPEKYGIFGYQGTRQKTSTINDDILILPINEINGSKIYPSLSGSKNSTLNAKDLIIHKNCSLSYEQSPYTINIGANGSIKVIEGNLNLKSQLSAKGVITLQDNAKIEFNNATVSISGEYVNPTASFQTGFAALSTSATVTNASNISAWISDDKIAQLPQINSTTMPAYVNYLSSNGNILRTKTNMAVYTLVNKIPNLNYDVVNLYSNFIIKSTAVAPDDELTRYISINGNSSVNFSNITFENLGHTYSQYGILKINNTSASNVNINDCKFISLNDANKSKLLSEYTNIYNTNIVNPIFYNCDLKVSKSFTSKLSNLNFSNTIFIKSNVNFNDVLDTNSYTLNFNSNPIINGKILFNNTGFKNETLNNFLILSFDKLSPNITIIPTISTESFSLSGINSLTNPRGVKQRNDLLIKQDSTGLYQKPLKFNINNCSFEGGIFINLGDKKYTSSCISNLNTKTNSYDVNINNSRVYNYNLIGLNYYGVLPTQNVNISGLSAETSSTFSNKAINIIPWQGISTPMIYNNNSFGFNLINSRISGEAWCDFSNNINNINTGNYQLAIPHSCSILSSSFINTNNALTFLKVDSTNEISIQNLTHTPKVTTQPTVSLSAVQAKYTYTPRVYDTDIIEDSVMFTRGTYYATKNAAASPSIKKFTSLPSPIVYSVDWAYDGIPYSARAGILGYFESKDKISKIRFTGNYKTHLATSGAILINGNSKYTFVSNGDTLAPFSVEIDHTMEEGEIVKYYLYVFMGAPQGRTAAIQLTNIEVFNVYDNVWRAVEPNFYRTSKTLLNSPTVTNIDSYSTKTTTDNINKYVPPTLTITDNPLIPVKLDIRNNTLTSNTIYADSFYGNIVNNIVSPTFFDTSLKIGDGKTIIKNNSVLVDSVSTNNLLETNTVVGAGFMYTSGGKTYNIRDGSICFSKVELKTLSAFSSNIPNPNTDDVYNDINFIQGRYGEAILGSAMAFTPKTLTSDSIILNTANVGNQIYLITFSIKDKTNFIRFKSSHIETSNSTSYCNAKLFLNEKMLACGSLNSYPYFVFDLRELGWNKRDTFHILAKIVGTGVGLTISSIEISDDGVTYQPLLASNMGHYNKITQDLLLKFKGVYANKNNLGTLTKLFVDEVVNTPGYDLNVRKINTKILKQNIIKTGSNINFTKDDAAYITSGTSTKSDIINSASLQYFYNGEMTLFNDQKIISSDYDGIIQNTGAASEKVVPKPSISGDFDHPIRTKSSSKFVALNAGDYAKVFVYVAKTSAYSTNFINTPRLMVAKNVPLGINEDTVLNFVDIDTIEDVKFNDYVMLQGTTQSVLKDGVLEFYIDCSGDNKQGTAYINVDSWSASTDNKVGEYWFSENGETDPTIV